MCTNSLRIPVEIDDSDVGAVVIELAAVRDYCRDRSRPKRRARAPRRGRRGRVADALRARRVDVPRRESMNVDVRRRTFMYVDIRRRFERSKLAL